MRTTRTTAVVLAGTALCLPATAAASTDGQRARKTSPPPRVLPLPAIGHRATVLAHRAHHLRRRAVHLAGELDRTKGHEVRVDGVRRRVRYDAVPRLHHRVRVLGHRLQRARAAAPATPAAAPSSTLQAIAQCESGGNPSAIGGGGLYRGKYQFDEHTWESVGGTGDPAAAPEAEQDRLAAVLYAREGTAPWPVCGG